MHVSHDVMCLLECDAESIQPLDMSEWSFLLF